MPELGPTLRPKAYGEGIDAPTDATTKGPLGKLHKGGLAASPEQLAENGGNHWLGEIVNIVDDNGNVVRPNYVLNDTSWVHEHVPNHNTVETWGEELPEGHYHLVHSTDVDQPSSPPADRVTAKVSQDTLDKAPPSGSNYVGPQSSPEGAIHKRAATPEELAASEAAEKAAQQPVTEEPAAQPAAEQPATPATPAPTGAQPVAPVTKDQIAEIKDPNAVFDAHSASLDPSDQRITRRINPDTGSNKLVGQYVVPGDPVHDQYFLSGLSPENQAKLPWISDAIARGGPFSYLYDSAQQYKPGGKVTGQSRQMEQAASTAQQRISGEHEAQLQRTTMLPMQIMATQPGVDDEGNTIPSNLLLEGFLSDAVMNNANHLFQYAQKGDIPVPYNGPNDFNFQRDVSGYLENQAHGFRGDGSMMLDENGQPHPLWKANQAKDMPYVPHLMQRPNAEFVHAMMNIRAPKNPKPPTSPPGFGERAAWQRRINEGYEGSTAGVNNLLAKLDKQFPDVRVYRARKKKDKETGEVTMEKYVHHHAPFSEASILEPTWRAYRVELMHHEMPPIGTQSLRGDLQAHLVHTAPEFKQTLATYRPHQPGAAPVSENPEVGAPIGAGDHIDPDRVTHRHADSEVHWVPTHIMDEHWQRTDPNAYIGSGGQSEELTTPQKYAGAFQHLAGKKKMHAPEVAVWDNGNVRFNDGRHRFAAMRDAGHSQVPIAFFNDSIDNAKNHGLIPPEGQPEPIGENPEVGAPLGEAGEEGGPDILSQEAASQGEEPQTFEAVSPSVKEDQSFIGAKRALKRPAHKQFTDFSNRVEAGLAQARGTQPARLEDTIGDWNDGAEPTLAAETTGHDYEDRRIANAIKGHYAAQKQALLFRHYDEGPHSLYRLALNTDNEEEARELLNKAGLGVRTLYPASKGQPVHVHIADLSEDGKLLPSIERFIKSGHVQQAWHNEGLGELIGDQNGESRAAAAQAYRRILQEARSRWDQTRAGGTAPEDDRTRGEQAPWWEPFAREAEENYQKLAATQELRKQYKALSLKTAKAHREDVPLERQRMLAQGQQQAQNWVGENPQNEPMSAHQFLDKHETLPKEVDNNEDVGEFFDKRNKLDYNKAGDRTKAAKALTYDIMHALSRNSSALGWYGETVRKAMDKFSEIAPELKTDKASNLAFRLALAITSQGQDVFANAESAWKAYQYWKEHGSFPTENAKETFGGGIKAPQMLTNFAKANRFWNDEHKGNTEAFENWLGQNIRHGDLTEKYKIKVGNTKTDVDLPMSAVFGPKIGVFFRNLSGDEKPITMDLWFSRTMNRLAGDMFDFSPDALRENKTVKGELELSQLHELRELLNSDQLTEVDDKTKAKMRSEIDKVMAVKNLTRQRANNLMPTIRDWAKRQHKFYAETITNPDGTERSYHPDRATAENLNAKAIDENFKKLAGDPRNGTERENWIKVMDEVRGNMEKAGINITNADRQALLWYLEQRLFQEATGSRETSYDYLDAAHHLVRSVKEQAL